ncbi:MAG TPA: cobalamin B12-binding domain-containing protein [Deltaproteobacteria bacterium]|nr:cobalamin B12-binding domain-containing protein [Deltaproteobacteria bacterium]HIJ41195.1 cobalamin B12-binding domain-containing protein [Deltaproteobacteria bacterium]
MAQQRRLRVMVAKPGLDGHDRGARIIARAYRDAGFEVVYTGLHQTPEEIVEAAIQEDVDMIGMSSLAGAHKYLFKTVVEMLKERDADDIVVCGGGIIPNDDIVMLKEAGVKEIFTPGTTLDDIVKWVKANVTPR